MHRVPALLAILCLPLLGLTACGDKEDPGNTGKVTVTGEFGAEPTVKFDGRLERESTEYTTLVEGSGPEVKDGDTALVNFYQGNGYTQTKAASTYDKGQKPLALKVTKEVFKGFREAIIGQKAGSRVQVLATPKDAFGGQGNPDVGIGNADSVVLVIDIMDLVRTAPGGTEKKLPAGMPTLTEKDGKPTGFDFSQAARSAGANLRVVPLVEGDGPAVAKGSQVALRYLGQVWRGKKPFDDNYDAEFPGLPDPATQQPGPVEIPGSLITGWNRGLIGVKAGSRVLLVVPSRLGYGDKGSGKQIKPGDDLVFVIDVLGVA